ncbi:MAG: hypothetical protein KF889_25680 [Alphaproteobacteria bacterium]|nr:hypothetical protein [Alphaproteobacteria bacterium]MCW5739614.1 hypothetical protein [Alphaproteobacteria bacterium]
MIQALESTSGAVEAAARRQRLVTVQAAVARARARRPVPARVAATQARV